MVKARGEKMVKAPGASYSGVTLYQYSLQVARHQVAGLSSPTGHVTCAFQLACCNFYSLWASVTLQHWSMAYARLNNQMPTNKQSYVKFKNTQWQFTDSVRATVDSPSKVELPPSVPLTA